MFAMLQKKSLHQPAAAAADVVAADVVAAEVVAVETAATVEAIAEMVVAAASKSNLKKLKRHPRACLVDFQCSEKGLKVLFYRSIFYVYNYICNGLILLIAAFKFFNQDFFYLFE